MPNSGRYVVGIDVGGTFTDLVAVDTFDDRETIYKSPTMPDDIARGVMEGLAGLAETLGRALKDFLAETRLVVHGTTITTNAVLTDRGAKTALVTTEGFRDVLQMRRGVRSREHLYDNKYQPPAALVPRYMRYGVRERVMPDGSVRWPLDRQALEQVVDRIVREGVEAVAVCYMHSYANPAHELATRERLQAVLPSRNISLSCEVAPMMRLYERVSTTVVNAYVTPVLAEYLDHLTAALAEQGFTGELLIMQSNGGITGPGNAARHAAATVLSGPAAGPVAGAAHAQAVGLADCLVVDMGGTSFDASLVINGTTRVTAGGEINRHFIALPMVAIHTIGAGGGSVAWVDPGGLLRVGPQSAGANPGPACYGRGGEQPTVSDADLVLGYLNPDYFLGGRMTLDLQRAEQAICSSIAEPLGMDVVQAAFGIFQIVNLNMANGIKEITIQNGVDPRAFPLLVAGGAGPVHAAGIARELGITRVLVPEFASVLCATGMLASNLRHDYVRSYYQPWDAVEPHALTTALQPFYKEGRDALAREGAPADAMRFRVGLDVRYRGQHYEVTVEVPWEHLPRLTRADIGRLFHDAHDKLYGYHLPDHPLELINLRLTAEAPGVGFRPKGVERRADGAAFTKAPRRMLDPFRERFVEAQVVDAEQVPPAHMLGGPLIVEAPTTTIVVPDGCRITLAPEGVWIMEVS